MGAVARAVGDFVEGVADAVGDVFEAVGDVVEDVVDAVGDVVEKVGDVVQAVIDDPLPVLLSVAGSFVGIPPFVTMGAITAARGGDLEDIALSMGTAFVGSAAGVGVTSAIADTVSSTFIEAGLNETFSEVASNSITKGLVNGTITELKGGDFEDGFAGGVVGGVVQSGVSDVGSYFKDDVIQLAQNSGLDLNDATSVYNSTVRAVTSGVTSAVRGGDFATSFSNSIVGSTINAGVNSANATIDEQFNTAATVWNSESKDDDKVDTTVTGAGIPDTLVGEVKVSDTGFDTTASTSTFDSASVLKDTLNTKDDVDSVASSDTTIPEGTVTVTQAPTGETTSDFQDLITTTGATSDDSVLVDAPVKVADDVKDIAESLPTDTVVDGVPTGALASVSETLQPVSGADKQVTAVVSDAPVSSNLLTNTLAQDATADQPAGGLNAVSTTAPQDKMASSLGLKPTDITKPLVATAGSLLKSSLTQPKRPVAVKPTGGLKVASVKPKLVTPPPAKVDVAKLIPLQKAAPITKTATVAPPKTLASTAKLSPVTNIAGLTSLVKKVG